jgi:hypothetical protein
VAAVKANKERRNDLNYLAKKAGFNQMQHDLSQT